MISILIPTYNYNLMPLVTALHSQAMTEKIAFEILVYDDCSPNLSNENEKINSFLNTSYTVLPKNKGRSAIRNKLAKDAAFESLLFLDADTKIIRDDFLQKYMEALNPETEIIYGGIEYQKEPPPDDQILRWIYGNEREALSVQEREKNPHLRFLTLNFLIKKTVFETIKFNEEIPNLRHEDTLFALDAKKNNINVQHIDNPVMHLGLESSNIFLKKSRESVESLRLFVEEGLIAADETSLSAKAEKLNKLHLGFIGSWYYDHFGKSMERNLLSKNPSLLLFDLYRLGYYLSIK